VLCENWATELAFQTRVEKLKFCTSRKNPNLIVLSLPATASKWWIRVLNCLSNLLWRQELMFTSSSHWEHLQWFSVCDPAKIFLTSKFSYFFPTPPIKLKLGLQIGVRQTTNSNPSRPIIMIGQSKTGSGNFQGIPLSILWKLQAWIWNFWFGVLGFVSFWSLSFHLLVHRMWMFATFWD
jgi:hypothetical protein